MKSPLDSQRRKLALSVFRMPLVQTMVQRKSSITNAFVNSVIPVVVPSAEEIVEALSVLGMELESVQCAYCGDQSSEWDHLRPLVTNRRPTGFISEIANLVPACGKCNQSKGNKHWRKWMTGAAPRSPAGRKIRHLNVRVERLEAFERWREPTRVDFEAIVGKEAWEHYWSLCDAVNEELREAQEVAKTLQQTVLNHVSTQSVR